MLSLEGKQLGNYDVIRRIRVGGMGAVYEGRQRTAFDRRVAIKVILGDYAADRDMRRRFAREARTIARLHHPHILPLIEFGDEKGVLYLVMPFIEGGTLTSYLRRSLPDLGEVSAIYEQLLDAVEYAHDEGLIHRDIKSSNVLLEMRRNAPPYIYLADFGLVRTMRQGEPSQTGKPIPLDQVPGTPHYMAPEQTRGIVTPLTDIYALGVLLFQLLTGNLPYNDPDEVRVIQMHLHSPIPAPSEHDASIPAELDMVVQKAMAKNPEERYRSVADLRKAFLLAVKGPTLASKEEDEEEPTTLIEPSMHRSKSLSKSLTPPPTAPTFPRKTQPMRPQEVPEPIIIQRRVQNPTPILAPLQEVQEWQSLDNRQRTTDTIKQRQRNTEEPIQRRKKRVAPALLATLLVLVAALLISLLVVPRVLGFSIIPTSFSNLTSPSVAHVYVTAQTKSIQNKYLLTATTQVQAPNLTTHTIPDRLLEENASTSSTVATTGSRTAGGAQAHGRIDFTNNGDAAVQVNSGTTLVTTSGVHIQTTQAITVPAKTNGQPGKESAPAIVVANGAIGNIAAHALTGNCCTNTLTIDNPAAFTGGADVQTIHYVLQADLDNVKNEQQQSVQQKVLQQLQAKLTSDEVIAAQPEYKVDVTSNIPVGGQADQIQVSINVVGDAAVYNRLVAEQMAIQLLSNQAAQSLDPAYHAQDKPTLVTPPVVEQIKDGVIYLNVSVHGIWVYTFTHQQVNGWLPSIKGATTEAAQAYLKSRPGISAVDIQLPFGTSQLPASIDNIKVELKNSAS